MGSREILSDDLTTKARIRNAAIKLVGEHGINAMTARKVAKAAGVSPGLVIHHYGSMEDLRSTCDEHVAATIRSYKQEAASGGPGIDVLAAIREADIGPLAGYLAAVLADDSPSVAKLVDNLVDDAEDYCRQFVEAGMMRPTSDPRGRAAVLLLWGLGSMVMHKHLQRILGVDIIDPEFGSDPASVAYASLVHEIYSEGIYTEEFAARVQNVFDRSADGKSTQKE